MMLMIIDNVARNGIYILRIIIINEIAEKFAEKALF